MNEDTKCKIDEHRQRMRELMTKERHDVARLGELNIQTILELGQVQAVNRYRKYPGLNPDSLKATGE